MIRAGSLRAALASVVALCSLVVVASAGAAAWQGPLTISEPGVNSGDSPLISLGASGDAAAGWFDTTNGRAVLARKRAGAAWSAPVGLVTSGSPVFVFTAVDGAGNVTAAVTVGGLTTVATWAAAAALPTLTTLTPPGGGPLIVDDLQVNSAGDAVLVGESPTDLITAYRHGFASVWEQQRWTANSTNARAAINASGTAVVVYLDAANLLWGSTRTASVDWALAEKLTLKTTSDIVPTVGIDGAGNYLTAFTYDNGSGAVVVHSVLRSPGAGPLESDDLSSITTGVTASQVQVVVNPAGAALLVWKTMGVDSSVLARFGTTGAGWGPLEPVNDAGADTPVAAIGPDGRAAVAWEREVAVNNNIGQARIRAPGSAGTWADIHNLNGQHTVYTKPSISADARGDFAVVTAPGDGVSQPVSVSAYDAAPPTVSAIALAGTLYAGDPVGLSVTATDEWSAVGTPTWTFGDGTAGAGAAVSHTYAASGIYVAHVSVSDGSANTSDRDITIVVIPGQSTLSVAKFSAKWKQSRVSGTLLVAGTTPRAGNYDVDATKGKMKIHASLQLSVGGFSRTIKLPAKLLPGTYHVTLTPTMPEVKPASQDVQLAAPPEGVVDNAWMAGGTNGPPTLTLHGIKKMSAHFHFATLPKGQVVVTWYRLGKKRKRLTANNKAPRATIVAYLGPDTFAGTYQAVLTRKGVVVAKTSVKAFAS